jgi:hypothetical protein
MRPYLIILYFIVCVIIGAVGDAFFDNSLKLYAHGLDAIEVGLLLSAGLIFKPDKKWWAFLIVYLCMRIMFFDISYNLSCGLPWDYIGNTSLWDKWFSRYPVHGLYFTKGIFFILGISISTRYLKPVNKYRRISIFGED